MFDGKLLVKNLLKRPGASAIVVYALLVCGNIVLVQVPTLFALIICILPASAVYFTVAAYNE